MFSIQSKNGKTGHHHAATSSSLTDRLQTECSIINFRERLKDRENQEREKNKTRFHLFCSVSK